MNKNNLKRLYPKAFAPIKVEREKSSYTQEEKYKLFAERQIVVPAPHKNKKRYDRKRMQKPVW